MSIGSIVAAARASEGAALNEWRQMNAEMDKIRLAWAKLRFAIALVLMTQVDCDDQEAEDARARALNDLYDQASELRRRHTALVEAKLVWSATHGGIRGGHATAGTGWGSDHHRGAETAPRGSARRSGGRATRR